MTQSAQLVEVDRGRRLQQADLAVSRALLGRLQADPDEALTFALGTVADVFGAAEIALVALGDGSVSVDALWSQSTARASTPAWQIPMSALPDISTLTAQQRPVTFPVAQLPPALATTLASRHHQDATVVAIPLIATETSGSMVLGALAVISDHGQEPTPCELRFMESVGGAAWAFLARRNAAATLARRMDEAELLAGFGALIAEMGPTIKPGIVTDILQRLSNHIGGAAMAAYERIGNQARPFRVWDPDGEATFEPMELEAHDWDQLRQASPRPRRDGDWTIYPALDGTEIHGMLAIFRDGGIADGHGHVISETIKLLQQLRWRAVAEEQLRHQSQLGELRSAIATSYVAADHWQVIETTIDALRAVGVAFGADQVMWLSCAEDREVVIERVWSSDDTPSDSVPFEGADKRWLTEASGPCTTAIGTTPDRKSVVIPATTQAATEGAIALTLARDSRRDSPSDLAVLGDIAQLIQTMEAWATVEAETEIRRERLKFQATHDDLTGLGNRRLMLETLALALTEGPAAVFMIDLDRFKVVNDSLGHNAGDAVLTAIADRLRLSVREHDLTCRFGGDEFAVMVPRAGDQAALAALAQRLIEIIREPVTVHGTTVIPTCSIGIAVTTGEDDLESALGHADAALYEAKRLGRDRYEFFNDDRRESIKDRLALETGLRQGLRSDQFVPWFQPEVDLLTRQIVGVEALIRWNHPVDGMRPAGTFIDVAEEVGLAPEMSRIALEGSCEALSEWRAMGLETRARINVAAAQLQTGDLDSFVEAALNRHGLSAECLCIEITERSLMLDMEVAAAALRRLRRLGVEVAIDDFGTGFSSLARLQGLPVDTLKIDRSFVAGLCTSRTDRDIVSTIISLAEAVGLDVVAEGVETEAQAEILTELGCRRAQGWLWSGALPREEIPSLLVKA